MNENDNDKEISKAKKIRSILLLKTDQEMKINSKKEGDIKINSKTIQELNQAYNSYKILISESTSIYSNYVELIQKMHPINSFREKKPKETPNKKREEQNNISLNSSFESHCPAVDFVPNKIDLGKRKISFRKKNTLDSTNSPKIFEEINKKETEDIIIKSTKLRNKNINKVIDKIVCLKLQDDFEDNDNNIKKNVMKLRKYCYKLIKKKKKVKKQKQSLSVKRKPREKSKEGFKISKRKTIIYSSYFNKNSLLFGKKEKENNQDPLLTRENTLEFKSNHFQSKLSDKEKQIIRYESIDSQDIKNIKLNSFKDLKIIKERAEDINQEKKNKFRRMQTLNNRNQPSPTKYTKKQSLNKESSLKQVNEVLKGSMVSTKFARPSKFIIINNNINNSNIYVKNDLNKKNNLFGLNRLDFRKQKTIKEKDRLYLRNNLGRKAKYTVKMFSSEFKKIKTPFNS